MLRLVTRQEISHHLGGLHGGAHFTRNATVLYQKAAMGDLIAHTRVAHEEREKLHLEHEKARASECLG